MRRRYLVLLVPAVLAMVRYAPRLIAGSELRTQSYFALQRQWMAHWPYQSGKYLPRILLPGVLPVVPVWHQVEPHIKMRLDPSDFVSRTVLETGQWEAGSFEMVHEHLSAGATFIDVGADIGYYSLKAATVVGSEGHVIAIEPNPQTVELLRANIAASGATVVAVAPVACSDAEAMLDLYAAPAANLGESSLSKSNASQVGAVTQVFRVRAEPLDEIVRKSDITRVDAIKIDVEGAEYLVLKGSQQTLDRFHPMILVELIDRQLHEMGSSSEQVKALLHHYGYREGRRSEDNVEFVPTTSLSMHTQ
jgi:FkbM family methyltransferase